MAKPRLITCIVPPTGYKPKKWADLQRTLVLDSELRALKAEALAEGKRLVRKDVLYPGEWRVTSGEEPYIWNVTPEKIKQLAESFKKATKQAGYTYNLVWGHGDPETKVVDARDVITKIRALRVEGGRLYAYCILPANVLKDLQDSDKKVSVRAMEDYVDGAGNEYPVALLHVAVVDLPVVGNQGPWIELATRILNLQRSGSLAMDFDKLKGILNELFGYFGMALPEETAEDNLESMVDVLMGMWRTQYGGQSEESPPEGETPTEPASASQIPGSAGPANARIVGAEGGATQPPASELGQQVASLSSEIKSLKGMIVSLSQGQTTNKRQAFQKKLTSLAATGAIDGKRVDALIKYGSKADWDLGLLDAAVGDVQPGAALDMGQKAKIFATSRAPVRGMPVGRNMPQAQVDELASELGAKAVGNGAK